MKVPSKKILIFIHVQCIQSFYLLVFCMMVHTFNTDSWFVFWLPLGLCYTLYILRTYLNSKAFLFWVLGHTKKNVIHSEHLDFWLQNSIGGKYTVVSIWEKKIRWFDIISVRCYHIEQVVYVYCMVTNKPTLLFTNRDYIFKDLFAVVAVNYMLPLQNKLISLRTKGNHFPNYFYCCCLLLVLRSFPSE